MKTTGFYKLFLLLVCLALLAAPDGLRGRRKGDQDRCSNAADRPLRQRRRADAESPRAGLRRAERQGRRARPPVEADSR